MSAWKLVVEKGENKGKSFKLKGNGSVSVGRSSKNGIVVVDDLVSRLHCRFVSRDKHLYIQDCDSHNGTLVNFQSIKKLELHPGDMIRLGETEISVLGDEDDPFIGKSIEGYHFLKRLGGGGEGTVYLAEQLKLKREVAVKILKIELVKDPKARARFVNEARTAATLSHSNLVGIYDIVEDLKNDLALFSMEYMSGGSLADIALVRKKLSVAEVVKYIKDALDGLTYIHEKNLVHRDIKPANFMLDEKGVLKIVDFGITGGSTSTAEKGHVMGSPHFMSPEHIQGLDLDARSDLYSLGCSAFRLMSGMPPFVGSTVEDILHAHLNDPPPSFRHAVPKIKLKLAKALDRLLCKDPNDRYKSAADFKKTIEKLSDKKRRRRAFKRKI